VGNWAYSAGFSYKHQLVGMFDPI